MKEASYERKARVMRVHVAPGSRAEKICRSYAGRPGQPIQPEAIARGIPQTPSHDLHDRGGKVIQDLVFTNFYVGGSAAWKHDDVQRIDDALAAAMSDQNLNNVMVQYFRGAEITSTFRPSHVLPEPASATFSRDDVEKRVRDLHGAGQLNGFPFGSTIFNLLLPRGIVLTLDDSPGGEKTGAKGSPAHHASRHIPVEDEASSLEGLGGYHGSVQVGDQTLYYAVGVFSEKRSDGTQNGIPVFEEGWKNVVATFYHELNEARTDPDVEDANRTGNENVVGWTSNAGEEVGDFPVFEADPLTKVFKEVPLTSGSGKVPIQLQYSNFLHGPEGPVATARPPAGKGQRDAARV